jgi:hypothetical protein
MRGGSACFGSFFDEAMAATIRLQADALLPTALDDALPGRLGVCVVGEARTFSHELVRSSLRRFLDVNRPPIVDFDISRGRKSEDCSSWRDSRNATLCAQNAELHFNLTSDELRAEFPEARITLQDVHDCASVGGACCSTSTLCAHGPPSGWLQYSAVASCLYRVARAGAPLGVTHVVRTRPDIVYYPPLDRTPLLHVPPAHMLAAPALFARKDAISWLREDSVTNLSAIAPRQAGAARHRSNHRWLRLGGSVGDWFHLSRVAASSAARHASGTTVSAHLLGAAAAADDENPMLALVSRMESACRAAVLAGTRGIDSTTDASTDSEHGADCGETLASACNGCPERALQYVVTAHTPSSLRASAAIEPAGDETLPQPVWSFPALICRPRWFTSHTSYESPKAFFGEPLAPDVRGMWERMQAVCASDAR